MCLSVLAVLTKVRGVVSITADVCFRPWCHFAGAIGSCQCIFFRHGSLIERGPAGRAKAVSYGD